MLCSVRPPVCLGGSFAHIANLLRIPTSEVLHELENCALLNAILVSSLLEGLEESEYKYGVSTVKSLLAHEFVNTIKILGHLLCVPPA